MFSSLVSAGSWEGESECVGSVQQHELLNLLTRHGQQRRRVEQLQATETEENQREN